MPSMLESSLNNEKWLLRPSTSFVHVGENKYDFFQSSTRRSRSLKLSDEMAEIIRTLDGNRTIDEITEGNVGLRSNLNGLISYLNEHSLVETATIREFIDANRWRRTLNFLGDYFPCSEIPKTFETIQSKRIAIIGMGAIGSWVAVQLAHMGITKFVLVDDDIVELSNLNRSVFLKPDVGLPKIECISRRLISINSQIGETKTFSIKVENHHDCAKVLDESRPDIIINAADYPSVDETSAWLNAACQSRAIPYLIAGGYNMHLSIIGMTVIPGKTACIRCGEITLSESDDKSLEGVRRLWRPKRNLGSISPLAGIASSISAMETLRLAVDDERLVPSMLNRRGEFNFLTNKISFVDLRPRIECGCCEDPL